MPQGRFPDFSRFLAALQGQAPGAADQMAAAVSAVAPVQTGQLRDSIRGDAQPIGDGVVITVGSDVPQAVYITQGTRDHGPLTAKVLRFEVAGGVIYAKHVRGISPNPFGEQAEGAIISAATDLVANALAEVSG